MAKKTRRSRIDDVLDQQRDELARMSDREVRRVLEAYEDSRRELRERLLAMELSGEAARTPFTAQQIRVALAQVEDGVAKMRERMGTALSDAERTAHDAALSNLVGTIKTAEPEFRDAGSRIEVGVLRRLSEQRGLLLHRYSMDRYGSQLVDAIQRELVIGATQGLTIRQLTDRIAGTSGSVFSGMRHRAELIARMETTRAYDIGHQTSIEELAAYDDPDDEEDLLLKKADEFFDHRNHLFSRALHDRACLPRQEWEVPIAEITGGLGGIVWSKNAAFVHGFGYPAHFNERGRQVAWRQSWGACRLQVGSFRVGELKKRDKRTLQQLASGPAGFPDVDAVSRRKLELAGYVDGQGRVLPAGRRRL